MMTLKEIDRMYVALKRIDSAARVEADNDVRSGMFLAINAATEGVAQHPDWYEGPCRCDECLSYGDAA